MILFVFILSARSRKPFQSQLSQLSLRQRIGSKVSRTRLNLRQLFLYLHICFQTFLHVNKLHTNLKDKQRYFTKFTSRLSITSFFKLVICSRRKIIYTFYLIGGKTERNEVSKQKHLKFNVAIDTIMVSTLKCFRNAVQVQLCFVLF